MFYIHINALNVRIKQTIKRKHEFSLNYLVSFECTLGKFDCPGTD